jgi:hypothetical protein
LAELRTITPVIGRAPRMPQTVFPTPWENSSRLYFVRGPRCIWSTAVAHNRVSALALTPMATAAIQMDLSPIRPKRVPGVSRVTFSSRLAFTSIRLAGRRSASATSVPATTATRAAGMRASRLGAIGFQATRKKQVINATKAAGPCPDSVAPFQATCGRASRFWVTDGAGTSSIIT